MSEAQPPPAEPDADLKPRADRCSRLLCSSVLALSWARLPEALTLRDSYLDHAKTRDPARSIATTSLRADEGGGARNISALNALSLAGCC
jgi:hypothetical protein